MLLNIFDKIGIVGIILCLLSIISLYLFIKNVILLWFIKKDFFNIFEKIEKGTINILKDDINKTNPLFLIIHDIAKHHAHHSTDIKSEVAYLFHKYFSKVSNSASVIRLISVIAPLLGLMGTMLGMVKMFRTISMVNSDSAILAIGIWEALLTTILGLIAAIPSLCFFYYIQLKIKDFRINSVEYSYRIVGIIDKKCPYGKPKVGQNE